jgi:hypothetical protein
MGGMKMMTLLLWETNDSLMPSDKEERGKLIMTMLEKVKKDLESGGIKSWGVSAGGGSGFSISEMDSKGVFERTTMYAPYVNFEVIPMLSVDEAIEVFKGMQK